MKTTNIIKISVFFLMIFITNISIAQGTNNTDSHESNKNTSSNITLKIRVKNNQGQAIWIKGVPVLISNVLPLAA